LSKSESHRKAMVKNMVTSLLRHERIETTKAKAKAIQVATEKMITRAKVDSVHNRRVIAKSISDEAILAKLFKEIGPRFLERKGGYTRIVKLGFRQGDAAEMVILELIKEDGEADSKKKAKKKPADKAGKAAAPKAAPKKAAEKKEAAPAPEAAPETAPAEAEVTGAVQEEAAPAAATEEEAKEE